jgi:DNA-binding NarL/FixJ family response regulator
MIDREPGWEVCGTAITGREAVQQAVQLQPDVVVLDMSMPDLNGFEAARQIKRALPHTEILIFTGFAMDEMIPELFEAGVKGLILKSEAASQLVDAIRSLGQHKPFFTKKVSEALFAKFLGRSGSKAIPTRVSDHLSAREREIVQLLAEGKSNKQVADTLSIGMRTVETHRAVITRKLHLDSFAALVRYAIRHNIIQA